MDHLLVDAHRLLTTKMAYNNVRTKLRRDAPEAPAWYLAVC